MSQIFLKVRVFLAYVKWRKKWTPFFFQPVRFHGNQENLFLAYFATFLVKKGWFYHRCADKPLQEI